MPKKNTQAIKRHKQNLRRRAGNRHVKATVKSRVKLFLTAIEGKDTEKPKEAYKEAYKEAQAQLDKAGRKKVIHRRAAARKVSRLARKLNKKAAAG